MIPNPILYNDDTIMVGIIVCCLVVLAVVMIPKAIRHGKRLKESQHEESIQEEQEIQMIVLPADKGKLLSYKEKFLCRNEIKKRDCVYISHDNHSMIMKLAKALDNMTIGGYVDTVLREHLKEYKDEINNIYLESRKNLL